MEAWTPALDDRVASAWAPRAGAARARRSVAQSGLAQPPLYGSLHRPRSHSKGGGGADGGIG
jgi:hypothetical protein